MNKYPFTLAILLLFLTDAARPVSGKAILFLSNRPSYGHPGGMHPKNQLDFVRKQIRAQKQPFYDGYRQLIAYADSALQHPTHALVDFSVPGYYDNAEDHRKNSRSLNSDSFDAYACALAWQLSGNTAYATKARELLNAWASTNTRYSEADGSLVMTYAGSGLVIAGELLLADRDWDKKESEQFRSWVTNVYRKAAIEIRTRPNNWADWGRFGSVLADHLLDDQTDMAETIRLIKSDLFHKIAVDGSMPEETRRKGNGLWYTYFSLAPITAACWIIYTATGENLFIYEQEGRSIKTALDYLLYYNQHPSEWTWFPNPRTGTPDSWPYNLFEALSGIYEDARYVGFVQAHRPFVYNSHHYAWVFPTLIPLSLHGYH